MDRIQHCPVSLAVFTSFFPLRQFEQDTTFCPVIGKKELPNSPGLPGVGWLMDKGTLSQCPDSELSTLIVFQMAFGWSVSSVPESLASYPSHRFEGMRRGTQGAWATCAVSSTASTKLG